jgi:16S rRNA (guanine527-N7)-methyltransferase
VKLNNDLLAKAAGSDGLARDVLGQLEAYADLLIETNQKINLVSRAVGLHSEIQNQLVLSLIPARMTSAEAQRWIDIGSGGGFPVVPMAILRPKTEFTAVEQVAKKAYFIERTAQTLGLQNLKVVASPIEEIVSSRHRSTWDVASIKAVADLGESLRWSRDLLGIGGLLVTYKPEETEIDRESVRVKYDFKHKASLNVKEVIDTIDVRVVVYEKL